MAVGREAVWIGDERWIPLPRGRTTLGVEEFPVGAEVLGVDVDAATGAVWVYVGDPAIARRGRRRPDADGLAYEAVNEVCIPWP